jgi:hypothetical protein
MRSPDALSSGGRLRVGDFDAGYPRTPYLHEREPVAPALASHGPVAGPGALVECAHGGARSGAMALTGFRAS